MHIPDAEEHGAIDMSAREDLFNELYQYVATLAPDQIDAKSSIYMILNSYEIQERCTELAKTSEDRNGDLIKRFLIAKAVSGRTERTLEHYRSDLIRILMKIGKNTDDITPDDIRYYMAIRQCRDKVSEVTIQNEVRSLSSFLA